MPDRTRYERYREDQTTVWISKSAQAFLAKERQAASEGTAAVLDRVLRELRSLRKNGPSRPRKAGR